MNKVRKYTDEQLKKLERRIAREYSSAQKELKKKWKDYMDMVEKEIKPYQSAYDLALKSGTKQQITEAKAALENIKKDFTLSSPRYNEMIDNLTDRMAHVNETAISYINDKTPDLYIVNHNAIAPTAKSLGINFNIINENTLKNVTMEQSLPLPKKLNVAKDKRWNAKKMNSSLLQGILQGESMDKIARRILPIVDSNQAAAIRSARTMVTQAENKGRLDSYHELQEMGTIVKKRWIATADERTRESHLEMDGEEVDLDETFSNGLQYPADPDGDPSEVYNCRCSMETVILGFMDADGNVNYIDQSLHEESEHAKDIEEEIEKRSFEETGSETKQFTPAQTIEEANKYGTDMLNGAYEDHRIANGTDSVSLEELQKSGYNPGRAMYGNLSTESANAFNSTINDLISDYDTPLNTIRVMTEQEYMMYRDSFAGVIHDYTTDTATMLINPIKCKDYNAYVERIKELIGDGFIGNIPEEMAHKYVATHEFGHTILNMANKLDDKRNWVNANYGVIRNARKEMQNLYDDYIKEVGAVQTKIDALEEKSLHALMNGNSKEMEAIDKELAPLYDKIEKIKISDYSLSNPDEFIAESFANEKIGKTSKKYAAKAVKIIDKYFRR